MPGFSTINPRNAQQIRSYERASAEALAAAVRASFAAYEQWRRTPLADRLTPLARLADLLIQDKASLGALATEEMGKPLSQAVSEVEKCALACRYYVEHAPALLADETVRTEHKNTYVAYRPIGPVLAIMPWNFPFWQVIRCAAPALTAGNTLLLKHADNTIGCALALAALMARAGFPQAVFTTLLADHQATEAVIASPLVRAVSLTGSERAGRQVGALAGQHLKKLVLELGGSDPYVVLRDADVALAAKTCVKARYINNGQSCVAAKRFIVEAPVYDAFTAAFVAEASRMRLGDPRQADTDIGPLARLDILEGVDKQVRASVAAGAQLLLGGTRASGPGYFYPATVLGDVRPGMPAFDEEVFGPVAALIRADDDKMALALANQSPYGLGGAIFSRDSARAERLAVDELDTGMVAINSMVASDPRLPFGGVRNSGYGRELAAHGLHEFLNTKTVIVD